MKSKKGISLSYSGLSKVKECPAKYYYSRTHVAKIKASALYFGKAVEAGVDVLLNGESFEEALRQFKSEWNTQPENKYGPAERIFDSEEIFYYGSDYDKNLLTRSDWLFLTKSMETFTEYGNIDLLIKDAQAKIKKNGTLEPEIRKVYHRVVWLCCRRRGIQLVKAFYDQILPNVVEVLSCQKKISMKNEDGDEITGYIDYILKYKGYKEPIVFDLKTSGKMYESHDLNTSDQLKIYAAAENLTNIGYIVLLKKVTCEKSCGSCGHIRENWRLTNCSNCEKGKYNQVTPLPATQVMVKDLSNKDLEDVLEEYHSVLSFAKNEIRWKNPRACFNFNKRCEYYDVCHNNKSLDEVEDLIKKDS